MKTERPDSALIRQYLNGELDARAMHQLEKRAQDDPFLMDALEGYAGKPDQQANLDELNSRIAQRVSVKTNRLFVLGKFLPVAASLLIALTVGYLFYNRSPVDKAVVAVNKSLAPVLEKRMDTNAAIVPSAVLRSNPVAVRKTNRARSFSNLKTKITKNDTTIAPPLIASNEVLKKEIPASPRMLKQVDTIKARADKNYLADADVVVNQKQAVMQQKLKGRVAGVNVTTASGEPLMLRGKVVDGNGVPITGAVISIKGDRKPEPKTMTDDNGNFAISAIPKKESLAVNFIGYESVDVKIKNTDSIKVALKENGRSLSEVVVTGYGAVKNTDPVAHPNNGWDAFNRYLKANAISGNGKTEIVKLHFTVKPDGSLGDIKAVKSTDSTLVNKAIDLIRNGPKWRGSRNGRDQQITLKIKFKK